MSEEGSDLSLVEVEVEVLDGHLAVAVHLAQVLDGHAQREVVRLRLDIPAGEEEANFINYNGLNIEKKGGLTVLRW